MVDFFWDFLLHRLCMAEEKKRFDKVGPNGEYVNPPGSLNFPAAIEPDPLVGHHRPDETAIWAGDDDLAGVIGRKNPPEEDSSTRAMGRRGGGESGLEEMHRNLEMEGNPELNALFNEFKGGYSGFEHYLRVVGGKEEEAAYEKIVDILPPGAWMSWFSMWMAAEGHGGDVSYGEERVFEGIRTVLREVASHEKIVSRIPDGYWGRWLEESMLAEGDSGTMSGVQASIRKDLEEIELRIPEERREPLSGSEQRRAVENMQDQEQALPKEKERESVLALIDPSLITGSEGPGSYSTFCELWGQDKGKLIYIERTNPDDDTIVVAGEIDAVNHKGKKTGEKKYAEARIRVSDLADAVTLGQKAGGVAGESYTFAFTRPERSDQGAAFFDQLRTVVIDDQLSEKRISLGEKEFALQVVGPAGREAVAKPAVSEKPDAVEPAWEDETVRVLPMGGAGEPVATRTQEPLPKAVEERINGERAEQVRWIPINFNEALFRDRQGVGDLLRAWKSEGSFTLEFLFDSRGLRDLVFKAERVQALIPFSDLLAFTGGRVVNLDGDSPRKGKRGMRIWNEENDGIVPGMTAEEIEEIVKRWRINGVPCPDGVKVEIRELVAR